MISAPFASGTFGQQRTVAHSEFFAVSLARHEPEVQLAPHAHERATATIVLDGAYEERIGGIARALPPMGVVVKPGGQVHANRIGTRGARTLLIELKAHGTAEFGAALELFARVSLDDVSPGADLVIRIVRELARNDDPALLDVECLTMEWIGLAERVRSPSAERAAPWLTRVRERLHDEPHRVPRLGDLAREAERHPIYVARAFRQAYGQSVGEYARRVRIAHAASRLASAPRASVSRVAQGCGYSDHSHLTHEFRARAGMTPTEWRRAIAG